MGTVDVTEAAKAACLLGFVIRESPLLDRWSREFVIGRDPWTRQRTMYVGSVEVLRWRLWLATQHDLAVARSVQIIRDGLLPLIEGGR